MVSLVGHSRRGSPQTHGYFTLYIPTVPRHSRQPVLGARHWRLVLVSLRILSRRKTRAPSNRMGKADSMGDQIIHPSWIPGRLGQIGSNLHKYIQSQGCDNPSHLFSWAGQDYANNIVLDTYLRFACAVKAIPLKLPWI